jgi:hypothetical protein
MHLISSMEECLRWEVHRRSGGQKSPAFCEMRRKITVLATARSGLDLEPKKLSRPFLLCYFPPPPPPMSFPFQVKSHSSVKGINLRNCSRRHMHRQMNHKKELIIAGLLTIIKQKNKYFNFKDMPGNISLFHNNLIKIR